MTEEKPRTKEELILIHKMLHGALDRLVACWIECTKPDEQRYPSKATLADFMQWSFEQTKEPECCKKNEQK